MAVSLAMELLWVLVAGFVSPRYPANLCSPLAQFIPLVIFQRLLVVCTDGKPKTEEFSEPLTN